MTVLDRVVVASKNPDKIAEIEDVLVRRGLVGKIVRGLEWDDVVEDGDTLEANALLKANAVYGATGIAALADDTGLEVDALDGAPGVYTARFAGPEATYADNMAEMLRRMDGVSNRRAVFRSVVAVVDGERSWTAEGSVEGWISLAPRGHGGFGYDPIFEVNGTTFAEMGADMKHTMSHRARAIAAIAEVLSAD